MDNHTADRCNDASGNRLTDCSSINDGREQERQSQQRPNLANNASSVLTCDHAAFLPVAMLLLALRELKYPLSRAGQDMLVMREIFRRRERAAVGSLN